VLNTCTREGGARKSGNDEWKEGIKRMGTRIWKKENEGIEVRKYCDAYDPC
jgi:hypothetical protein